MEQSEDGISLAQFKLAEAYFDKIRQYFSSLNSFQRKSLLNSLDRLVENNSPESHAKKKAVFDYEEARKIRETQGLTRKQLGQQVDLHEITLNKYETDRLVPNPQTSKKYFSWLERSRDSKA